MTDPNAEIAAPRAGLSDRDLIARVQQAEYVKDRTSLTGPTAQEWDQIRQGAYAAVEIVRRGLT